MRAVGSSKKAVGNKQTAVGGTRDVECLSAFRFLLSAYRLLPTAVCLLLLCLSASGFELPDGEAYTAPEDLDRWLTEGILQPDEWAQLREWLDRPLSLNDASPSELRLIPGLDDRTADELPLGRSLTDVVLELLAPFVNFTEPSHHGMVRQTVTNTLNDEEGAYGRGYLRLFPSEHWTLGLAETSGGTPVWAWDDSANQPRFADSSRLTRGYASWDGEGRLRKAIVGDYALGFGAGLTLNTTRWLRPTGITPNDSTSASERGLATEWNAHGIEGTAFLSRNGRSTRLPDISRLVENAVTDSLIGASAETEVSRWRVGSVFSAQRDENRTPFLLQDLSENATYRGGLYTSRQFGGLLWNGEISHSGAWGIRTELCSRDVRAVWYRLPTAFVNPLGSFDGDTQGAFVRLTKHPQRWTVGGQLETQTRLSTNIMTQRLRGWFSSPRIRGISGGASVYERVGNVLDESDTYRSVTEWMRVQTPYGVATGRLNQRWEERDEKERDGERLATILRWRVESRPLPKWTFGVGGAAERDRLPEVTLFSRVRMPQRTRLETLFTRKNRQYSYRMTLDFRWSNASS